MSDSATPVTAAAVRAALAKYEAASDELGRVLTQPPGDADRLAWANAVLIGFAGLDAYPGPRSDPDFIRRAGRHVSELAERCEADRVQAVELERTHSSVRAGLTWQHIDPALPTLGPGDFRREPVRVQVRRLAMIEGEPPTRDGVAAVVALWNSLAPDHPARRYLTEADCVDIPDVGLALVLDIQSVEATREARTVELWEACAKTRRVARAVDALREREERDRVYAEEARRERDQADAERLKRLEEEVASLRAARDAATV